MSKKIITPPEMDHKVTSIKELLELCKTDGGVDFYIALNACLKSSKHISWDGERFCIDNEIDDTFDRLTPLQLMDEKLTNIGKAVRVGSFYMNSYEKDRVSNVPG